MADNSERIDKFLREQMTPEESESFLNDLRTDKELRDETQAMALLIKEMKEEQARQDAEIVEEVLANKRKAQIIRLTKWIGSIAAMFILVLGGIHINEVNRMNHLFNEYYSAYDMSSARGGDDEAIRAELATLYNEVGAEKDLGPIITRLQTIYNHIQAGDEEYAGYRYYESDIAWYLALAYVKDHNLEKARELLQPLADTGDITSINLLNDIGE